MAPKIMATQDIYKHSIIIDRSVDDVWRALTQKIIVDRYYLAPLGADITAVGDELYYGMPENKIIVGQIVTLSAPAEFTHTFRFTDSSDPTETLVTYRLTTSNNSTRLDLQHSGFAAESKHFADISGGWPIILDRLKVLLEEGGTK